MQKQNSFKTVVAQPVTDGAGVHIRRGIGSAAVRNLDPFLMIDHFGSDDPGDYIAGFPDHPHRGFITLTYMIDGHMLHKDSMNNEGHLQSGGVQWMKAASGIIHSEMPQQEAGLMRGFQLWINLPAVDKMSDPAYQEFAANQIPVVEAPGCTVRVIAGEYRQQTGPVIDHQTQLSFLDVLLSGRPLTDPGITADCAFVYVFEGEVAIDTAHGTTQVGEHGLCLLDDNQHKSVTAIRALTDQARLVIIAGQSIGEPIVQHGPFVMNTVEEIQTAITDYQRGELVRTRASVTLSRD